MRRLTPRNQSIIHLIISAATLTGGATLLSCATAQRETDTGTITTEAAPAGIDNLHRVTDGLWSGAAPDGDAGFAALAALGITTIISVDANTPDLARIHAAGLRSVHLPIRYAGIEPDRRTALARAVRDANGPVYIHCHHGRHRGPAAAATAAIMLGLMTPGEGEAFLHRAGTSPAYPGLFECVRQARPLEAAELDAWEGELPEVSPAGPLPAVMARIGSSFEMLDRLHDRDWQPLPNHPDRTPEAEASSMHDAFRTALELVDGAESRFMDEMRRAVRLSGRVEELIHAGDLVNADVTFMLLNDSCTRCHDVYRGSGMSW